MLEKRKINKLKRELKAIKQALRVAGAGLYDMNVITTELAFIPKKGHFGI